MLTIKLGSTWTPLTLQHLLMENDTYIESFTKHVENIFYS